MLQIALICCVLAIDAYSKYWVHSHLPLMFSFSTYPYGGIGVFENWGGIQFSITHLTNKGAAWGVLSGYQDLLVAVRIVLIAALFIYALIGQVKASWRIPLALIIAGATGNVVDYFIYGHVVDMFHFVFWGYNFPVFNVADSAVCVGVFWLMLLTSFQQQGHKVSL